MTILEKSCAWNSFCYIFSRISSVHHMILFTNVYRTLSSLGIRICLWYEPSQQRISRTMFVKEAGGAESCSPTAVMALIPRGYPRFARQVSSGHRSNCTSVLLPSRRLRTCHPYKLLHLALIRRCWKLTVTERRILKSTSKLSH